MPNTLLSQAIKEAYASAPDDVVVYHTLEILHDSFAQPIRVVCNPTPINAVLEGTAPVDPGVEVQFVAFRFDFVLPEVDDQTANPEAQLILDNVSREIVKSVELAVQSTTPITAIYRPFLSTDMSQPHMNPPPQFLLTQVQASNFKVTATLSWGSYYANSFPTDVYTLARFPGLLP